MTALCRRLRPATLLCGMALLTLAPATLAASKQSFAFAPPTCEQSSRSLPESTPASIVLSCTDPSLQPQTIAIVSHPSHGTLGAIDQTSPTGATVTYTSTVGYNGPDSFTFGASGVGTSAPATVSLTVGWVDTYPAAPPPGWAGPPLLTLGGGPPASPASPGPQAAAGPPVLSAFHVTPGAFSIAGRRVDGRCVQATALNGTRPDCTRSVKLVVSFRVSEAGRVTFTLERATPGRREGARCVPSSPANHTRPACMRRLRIPGSATDDAIAGANVLTVSGRLAGVPLTSG